MSEDATPRVRKARALLRYWLPVVLWMALIFTVSSASSLPQHPDPLVELIVKKAGHAVEYGILAALLRRAFLQTTTLAFPSLWAFLFSLLYSVSDEFHQLFVANRQGTWVDVAIDATGATLALLIAAGVQRRREAGHKQ